MFDASARVENSFSLNSCLEKGVNLIEHIPNIILKFRRNRIGVADDIKKAFLQISLAEDDRNLLRFLWLDKNDQMITYRHTRVVFGVSSRPFLSGAVIQHHISNFLKKMSVLGTSFRETSSQFLY